MRSWKFVTAFAAAAAVSIPLAVWAHDDAAPRDHRGSMGSGMGQMMDHCSQMMQGNSGKPNDQWRDNAPPAGNSTEKQQ